MSENKVIETRFEKRVCTIHGEYEAEIFPALFGMGELESKCPECERLQEEQYKKFIQISEAKKVSEAQDAKYKAMRIRQRYYDATFDKVQPSTERQRYAISCLKRMAEVKRGTVVLLSDNGYGKTYMATCCLQAIGAGRYYKMYEISSLIRSTYVSGSKKSELEVIEELIDLPLLIIDEIGRTKCSDAELAWLSEIIDDRRNDYKPTILLSNKHKSSMCPKFNGGKGCEDCQNPSCFDHCVGSDILSRLQEETVIIEMDGTDRRSQA